MRTYSDDVLTQIQHLWERTPESATTIGRRFGLNKNQVIGIAHRRAWVSFVKGDGGKMAKRPHRTMNDRLDEVWAAFKAKMADLEPRPSHFVRGRHPLDVPESESPRRIVRYALPRSSAR